MRSLVFLLLLSTWSQAAPRVRDLSVVDLTAKSLRLVWNSGTDSRPEVDVFTNAAGTLPAPGITTTPFSIYAGDSTAINTATAEGVQEIQVSGLLPDTTYHLRARSVSVPAGSAAQSGLIEIRTAADTLLARSGAAATPFANPVLSFARAPSTPEYSAISALLVVTTPGARTGVLALTTNAEDWFIDLNGLVSATTGTPLALASGTPLDAALYTGDTGTKPFTLYAPSSAQLAEVRPPLLAPDPPLNARLLAPAPGLLLMEFAATAGDYHAVERSTSLGSGSWEEVQGATETEEDRFFFSTYELSAPKAFYRTRRIDVLAPP